MVPSCRAWQHGGHCSGGTAYGPPRSVRFRTSMLLLALARLYNLASLGFETWRARHACADMWQNIDELLMTLCVVIQQWPGCCYSMAQL